MPIKKRRRADELQGMLSRQEDFVLPDVCLKRDADKFWNDSPKRIHVPFDQLESGVDEIP